MTSVQIHCPRCKNVFRDAAMRVQNGYSRQCTSCEAVIFFNEDTENPVIKRVMKEARRVRKEMREAEAEAQATSASATAEPEPFSRSYSGRSRTIGRR
jgi:predicted  nucleic acid-binding Zn-ribbon protein